MTLATDKACETDGCEEPVRGFVVHDDGPATVTAHCYRHTAAHFRPLPPPFASAFTADELGDPW